MKANYITFEGQPGLMEMPVIVAQPMQQTDGFTIFGFDSWEEVHDEKISSAVTNIMSYNLTKDKVGFHG